MNLLNHLFMLGLKTSKDCQNDKVKMYSKNIF